MPKLTSAKTGLIAAATALTATLASPAIASADVVDDVLAKMPSGQISCSQAKSQYTNASDYNSKKRQALAVAAIHPRGGEVRVIANPFRRLIGLGKQGTAGGVAPFVPRPLTHRLLLRDDDPQPRGAIETGVSEVMEDAAVLLPYGRWQLLDGLATDADGRRVGPANARVSVVRRW